MNQLKMYDRNNLILSPQSSPAPILPYNVFIINAFIPVKAQRNLRQTDMHSNLNFHLVVTRLFLSDVFGEELERVRAPGQSPSTWSC